MIVRTLYTGGTFDILHYGHLDFLARCKKLAERVVVSLNDDDFIYKFKGEYPIMNYEERKKTLEHCKYVHQVVKNVGGIDSKVAIEQVKPSIIAVGTDWACKDYYSQMSFDQKWLDDKEISLVYIPYGDSSVMSTTEIKRRIRNEDRCDR